MLSSFSLRRSRFAPPASLLLAATLARGAASSPAPGVYSWTNPTPEAELRELHTDRPDVTEGPFTVDAGHAQFELDFANYSRDRSGGGRTTELAMMPLNLRLGLTRNFELGVFLTPYLRQTEEAPTAAKTTVAGVGDATFRAKINFWGNDGGESAAGIIIDLKLPTAARDLGNDKVEGGVTLPVSLELAGGWELGAMTSLALAHNGASYRGVWINSVTLGHEIVKDLGGYLELVSQTGDGPHVCMIDIGLTRRFGRHLQLDAGVNLGISRAAPDVRFFAGCTRRF